MGRFRNGRKQIPARVQSEPEPEQEVRVYDPLRDEDECEICGGWGLARMVGPGCGEGDMGPEDENEAQERGGEEGGEKGKGEPFLYMIAGTEKNNSTEEEKWNTEYLPLRSATSTRRSGPSLMPSRTKVWTGMAALSSSMPGIFSAS